MIYTGGNDGMLHAFDAATGEEAWAFIPKLVLPNLFKLADNNYANTHQFYVDGAPTVGDVYDVLPSPAAWKTILVGGLNKGGKGYYALDVTDPAAPKALWEFGWSDACWDGEAAGVGTDCHVGYSFGRPIISKLQDGTWVAAAHLRSQQRQRAGQGGGRAGLSLRAQRRHRQAGRQDIHRRRRRRNAERAQPDQQLRRQFPAQQHLAAGVRRGPAGQCLALRCQ
jgi:hypothetical protein